MTIVSVLLESTCWISWVNIYLLLRLLLLVFVLLFVRRCRLSFSPRICTCHRLYSIKVAQKPIYVEYHRVVVSSLRVREKEEERSLSVFLHKFFVSSPVLMEIDLYLSFVAFIESLLQSFVIYNNNIIRFGYKYGKNEYLTWVYGMLDEFKICLVCYYLYFFVYFCLLPISCSCHLSTIFFPHY